MSLVPVNGPESPRVPGRNEKHHRLQTLAEPLGTWGASTYAVVSEHALQEGSGRAQARGPGGPHNSHWEQPPPHHPGALAWGWF